MNTIPMKPNESEIKSAAEPTEYWQIMPDKEPLNDGDIFIVDEDGSSWHFRRVTAPQDSAKVDWLVWRANLVSKIADEMEGFGYDDPEEGGLTLQQVIEKSVFSFINENPITAACGTTPQDSALPQRARELLTRLHDELLCRLSAGEDLTATMREARAYLDSTAVAELAALKARPDAETHELNVTIIQQELEIERLKARVANGDRLQERARSLGEGYWAWQGDETDNLESLVCPVLIQPQYLLELLPRPDSETLRKAKEALATLRSASPGPPQDNYRRFYAAIDAALNCQQPTTDADKTTSAISADNVALRQRIAELEAREQDLDNALSQQQPTERQLVGDEVIQEGDVIEFKDGLREPAEALIGSKASSLLMSKAFRPTEQAGLDLSATASQLKKTCEARGVDLGELTDNASPFFTGFESDTEQAGAVEVGPICVSADRPTCHSRGIDTTAPATPKLEKHKTKIPACRELLNRRGLATITPELLESSVMELAAIARASERVEKLEAAK